MKRLFWVRAAICALSGLWVAPSWAQAPASTPAVTSAAQSADTTALPASGLKLPHVNEVRLPVSRQVQAASALLGYGRQRLALVVGIGTLGSRQVLDSAARDTQAVATALRAGGFVVMVREDVNGADLRSALKEYRERLQPDGVGFVYFTGLGAQVDGQNLLLPRNARLDADASAAAVAAQVKAVGVPLQEVVEALMSTPESARLLVVDAAYKHPALAKLPQPGLTEQRLPPGMLALFGHALAAAQDGPAVAMLPTPMPKDPREIAGSRFARVLVGTLVTPRISAADALRNTHKALVDGAPDQAPPWLGGKTDNKEDLAEASLLDGLFPRTPEELARETLKQITRAAVRDSGGSGAAAAAPTNTPSTVNAPSPAPARPSVPELPAGGGSALGSVTSTVSTVVSAAGSVATVAAGAATVAVGTQALVAATGTAATAATTTAAAAVSTAGSVAGSVVGGTARILSTSTGEQSARQAVQTTLARPPVASAATTATPAAAPGAATAAAASAAPAAATATVTTVAPGAATAAAATVAPAAAGAPAAAAAAVATPVAAQAATGAALSAAAPVAAAAPVLTGASLAAGAPAAVSSLTPSSGPTLPGGSPSPSPAAPALEGPAPATHMASPAATNPATNTAGNPATRTASNTANSSAGNTARSPLDGRTQRGAQGGEQPVYSPRTNRYGYSEGDTFTYQVVDAWKEEITGTFTTAIEEVLGDGQLLANSQTVEMDAQGRIKSQRRPDGTLSRFEPQQDLWWSNPKPGQTRDVSFKEFFDRPGERGQVLFEGSSKVGKLRKIETPAGEFEVMPIETTGYFNGMMANGMQRSGQFTRKVWYSPKLGHPVRIDISDSDRVGKLLVRERVELMHAQRAPQP